jgi:hypothetical protein
MASYQSIFCQNLPISNQGLIAYYSFDGNADDSSGNGNHGIVHGATLTSGRKNFPNTAYYFNGIDNYIEVADNESFQLADNKITIAVWTKVEQLGDRYFIYKGSGQTNREYYLGLRYDYLASFGINNQGGWETNQFGLPSNSKIESDKWYYITGTWDGHVQKIYVNGNLENIAYPKVEIGDFESNFYIGTFGANIEQYAINATIDDIMIFNKALSNYEIKQLYDSEITANFSINSKSFEYALDQNYPNPLNPTTTISFTIPQNEHVVIKLFDVLGSEISTLHDKLENIGKHEITVDASNLVSGVYYYSLKAGNYFQVRKLIVLK